MTRSACLVSLLLALGLAGCAPCAESSDIRVTIEAPNGVPADVNALAIGVTVNEGKRMALPLVPLSKPLTSGSALVLRPSAPISSSMFSIIVDITTMGGTTTLTGSSPQATLGTHACNELTVTLGSPDDLGVVGDDFAGDDLFGVDLAKPLDFSKVPDLAACTATTPDEDADGRGDACDVCAADANPGPIVDTDGDGVPDVCDPSNAVNKVVYFEPFNSAPSWIGALTVTSGAAQASLTATDTSAVSVLAVNTDTSLVADVLLETWVTLSQVSSGIDGEVALILATDAAGDGFRCVLGWQASGDPYLLVETSGGQMSNDPVPAGFPLNTPTRVRLSQHGNEVKCVLGSGSSSASTTTSSPIPGPLHPGIGIDFLAGTGNGTITASFSSLFAVTDP